MNTEFLFTALFIVSFGELDVPSYFLYIIFLFVIIIFASVAITSFKLVQSAFDSDED